MKIKSKDGSVALFVFIAVIFIAGVLVLIFALGTNESQIINKQFETLGTIYTSPNNDLSVIYDEINKKDIEWLSRIEQIVISEENLSIAERTSEEERNYIKGYLTQTIDGTEYKVPIPNNFYYVGGSIDKGLVISDDMNDAGRRTINEDKLVGNQFVWIPLTLIRDNSSTITDTNMLASINTYGGFFIGRYKSGYNIMGNTDEEKLIIKKSDTPYNDANFTIVAQNKYTQYVNSYVCTETLWNFAVNFINTKNSDWTINPKNNIYTTTSISTTEPYSDRIVIFVQI